MKNKNNKKRIENDPKKHIESFSTSGGFLTVGILLILTEIYKYTFIVGIIFIVISAIGFLVEYNAIIKKSKIGEEYLSDITVSVILGIMFIGLWYFSIYFPVFLTKVTRLIVLIVSFLPIFGFYRGISGVLVTIIKKGKKSEGLDLLIQMIGIIIALIALIVTL